MYPLDKDPKENVPRRADSEITSHRTGDWLPIFRRWCSTYQPERGTDLYDSVAKAATADWILQGCLCNYDRFLIHLGGRPPYNWLPWEIKMHNQFLRYKTSAERAFARANRSVLHYYKIQERKKLAAARAAEPQPQKKQPSRRKPQQQQPPPPPPLSAAIPVPIIHSDTADGYTLVCRVRNGVLQKSEAEPRPEPTP